MDIQDWVNRIDPEYLIEMVSEKRREMTTKRFELVHYRDDEVEIEKISKTRYSNEHSVFVEREREIKRELIEHIWHTSNTARKYDLVTSIMTGLMEPAHQRNINKKGKVRVLLRVLSVSNTISIRNNKQLGICGRSYNFDGIFKGNSCPPELLRDSLVTSIRYAIMGGNACVIPIGGPNMGKTPFLTYSAETALAWSLEVLKQQPRIKMRLSVIEGSDRLIDLINPDRPEIFSVEDPLLGPILSGHSEMLIRSALPGLRLLRRCFTRRQPGGHILVTLTFHLPNGAQGKLHLFDCGRGGSAILSNISTYIVDGLRTKYQQSEPLQALLREALGSTNNDICLIPHINGNEPEKSVAILQAVSRMHKVRQTTKRSRPTQPEVTVDCRSPLQNYGVHNVSSCSEATSQDTAIYVGGRRGYRSETDYSVEITPLQKQLKGSHVPIYPQYNSSGSHDNLLELPLPRKKSFLKAVDSRDQNRSRASHNPGQTKVFLSDQELSGIDSGHEEIVFKCKPRVQPKTYARTRALPLMSETEDESSKAKRRVPMETIREYPATDTEACVPKSQNKKPQCDAVRIIRMADGSLQLATGNSRHTLADSTVSVRKGAQTQSNANLKSSSSILNLLKFRKSKSTTTLSSSPSTNMSKAEDITMMIPNHNLSDSDRFIQCRDLRVKYNNILSRLPKKMRRKYEWNGVNNDSYTSEQLMRLEIETRKLEDIVDQSIIKNCGARKFSLFGLRLAI